MLVRSVFRIKGRGKVLIGEPECEIALGQEVRDEYDGALLGTVRFIERNSASKEVGIGLSKAKEDRMVEGMRVYFVTLENEYEYRRKVHIN